MLQIHRLEKAKSSYLASHRIVYVETIMHNIHRDYMDGCWVTCSICIDGFPSKVDLFHDLFPYLQKLYNQTASLLLTSIDIGLL